MRKTSKRRLALLGGALLVLAFLAAAMLLSDHVDWGAISREISGFNPVVMIALMCVLPLFGFSIAIVYLVVGARFGPVAGLPVIVGVTAFHLAATRWIARHLLRGPLQRWIERRKYHVPHILPGEESGICLFGALVPGIPYFARNYVLALAEIPGRVYFGVCLPVYVARSYLSILLGDLTTDPDGSRLFWIAVVYVVKLGLCAYVVWRLRRHRHPHPHGEGKAVAAAK